MTRNHYCKQQVCVWKPSREKIFFHEGHIDLLHCRADMWTKDLNFTNLQLSHRRRKKFFQMKKTQHLPRWESLCYSPVADFIYWKCCRCCRSWRIFSSWVQIFWHCAVNTQYGADEEHPEAEITLRIFPVCVYLNYLANAAFKWYFN